tara:strand:+ start:238 stop:444 length:207 start_codon:yes stop_codon:yes gene_type:complete
MKITNPQRVEKIKVLASTLQIEIEIIKTDLKYQESKDWLEKVTLKRLERVKEGLEEIRKIAYSIKHTA